MKIVERNWGLKPIGILSQDKYAKDRPLSYQSLQELADLSGMVPLEDGRHLLLAEIEARLARGASRGKPCYEDYLITRDITQALEKTREKQSGDTTPVTGIAIKEREVRKRKRLSTPSSSVTLNKSLEETTPDRLLESTIEDEALDETPSGPGERLNERLEETPHETQDVTPDETPEGPDETPDKPIGGPDEPPDGTPDETLDDPSERPGERLDGTPDRTPDAMSDGAYQDHPRKKRKAFIRSVLGGIGTGASWRQPRLQQGVDTQHQQGRTEDNGEAEYQSGPVAHQQDNETKEHEILDDLNESVLHHQENGSTDRYVVASADLPAPSVPETDTAEERGKDSIAEPPEDADDRPIIQWNSTPKLSCESTLDDKEIQPAVVSSTCSSSVISLLSPLPAPPTSSILQASLEPLIAVEDTVIKLEERYNDALRILQPKNWLTAESIYRVLQICAP